MKLFYAKTSPFVRKVLVVAHELGLVDRLELLPAAAHPINRDATIRAQNPLGQVPTLLLDDGTALADSRVICEYLDHLGAGGLFPAAGPARWTALAAQSTGDGLLDAALLCVYETRVRQETERSPAWVAGQREKIVDALARIEAAAPELRRAGRHRHHHVWLLPRLSRPAPARSRLARARPGGGGVVRALRRAPVDAGDPAGVRTSRDD